MPRAIAAIDPTFFVGVITPTNLNDVQEQPTILGYQAQAAAVIAAVNTLLTANSSDALHYLFNIASQAQRESSFTVHEHYVSEMRTFANAYYDEVERASRSEINEFSPEAAVTVSTVNSNKYAKALRVKRSAVRLVDVMLRMTRPLPQSTMRKLNAEVVNGTTIVMRKKPVLVSKRSYDRHGEFNRARRRNAAMIAQNPNIIDLQKHILLQEFYIAQPLNKSVNVAWLPTRTEVVLLSDNRVLSVSLAISSETRTQERYTTLLQQVQHNVQQELAPHRHLVSEHSRQYIIKRALEGASLEADKARLRAAREAKEQADALALIRPGRIRLTGHAATLVAALKRDLVNYAAGLLGLDAMAVLSAVEANKGVALVHESLFPRIALSLDEKRAILRKASAAIRHWHALQSASLYGVDPQEVEHLLLFSPDTA